MCWFPLVWLACGTPADAPDLSDYRTVQTAQAVAANDLIAAPAALPGHLGVSVETAGGNLRVAAVEDDSAAAKAGLRSGDELLTFAGTTITTAFGLREQILARAAGDRVEVGVRRDGQAVAIAVTLGAVSVPLTSVRPLLGVTMTDARDGVRVERVNPGSPADAAGLRSGDVILRFGDAAVATSERLRQLVGGSKAGDRVRFEVRRGDERKTVDVALTALTMEDARGVRWDDRMTVWRRDKYRLAVIPIAFADQKPNDRIAAKNWDDALFSTGTYTETSPTGEPVYGSLNDYYREQSCGRFGVTGKVFDAVTVTRKRADYARTNNRGDLLIEAMDAFRTRDGEDPLKVYDGLFFVYAGPRQPGPRGGIFWPHRATLTYRGRRFPYFIMPEGGNRMSSISIIAHEFGHMLGLPDLYATPDSPAAEGVGVWCTMSQGHGLDGKPLHFSAWCKSQLGWLDPVVLDPRVKQKLVLGPVHNSAKECYKILIRPDGSEYLLLENRLRRGFDKDLPGEGMLIWRVVDGRPVLEESHGVTGPGGPRSYLGAVPYPSRSNNAFTPDTIPSSKPVKAGGLPVSITNVRRLPDGRITFHIGYEYI